MTDEALMTATRGGDDDAFAQLIARHGEPLIGFLAKRLGKGLCSKAEDVAQIVWLNVYKAANYDPSRPFAAWLYTIARNAAKDALDAEASFRRLKERFIDSYPVKKWNSPENVERNELGQLALGVLKSLPLEQREAVYWTILNRHSTREAERLLGPSHRTISNRCNAGLAVIRAVLEDETAKTATIEPTTINEIDRAALDDVIDGLSQTSYDALERVLATYWGEPETASDADRAIFRDFVYCLVGD
jgi:RNA polymerase sigma-70 factor (ECF subfamily)